MNCILLLLGIGAAWCIYLFLNKRFQLEEAKAMQQLDEIADREMETRAELKVEELKRDELSNTPPPVSSNLKDLETFFNRERPQ